LLLTRCCSRFLVKFITPGLEDFADLMPSMSHDEQAFRPQVMSSHRLQSSTPPFGSCEIFRFSRQLLFINCSTNSSPIAAVPTNPSQPFARSFILSRRVSSVDGNPYCLAASRSLLSGPLLSSLSFNTT
jgi:hypothetical protein